MNRYTGKWVNAALGSTFLAIILFGVVTYRNASDLAEIADSVARTHLFLQQLENLISQVKDAETSQRGFTITGNEEFLAPFLGVEAEITETMKNLRSVFPPTEERDQALNNLEKLIARKMEIVHQTISLRKEQGFEAARLQVATTEGVRRMNAIRGAVETIEQRQKYLLASRQAEAERNVRLTHSAIIVGHSLLFFLLTACVLALRAERHRRDCAEETVRRNEAQIREQATFLNQVRDAIFVCDESNSIVYWNRGAEMIYGWAAAEAIGQKADELLSVKHVSTIEGSVTPVSLGEVWVGEFVHKTKFGKQIDIEQRRTVIRNESDQSIKLLMISIDISQRKEAEARELRRQRLESMGTLTGGIAHDLNNILTPILMGTKLLASGRRGIDAAGLLATIQSSAERGAEMIQQLLAFAGGVDGEFRSLDIREVINEVHSLLRHTFPKSIALEIGAMPQPITVFGDKTGLSQVLVNLCVNARDAMQKGGVLFIEARTIEDAEFSIPFSSEIRRASGVSLIIKDTGSGIPGSIIDKIFDPFFTTKPLGAGTGLGLSTSLGIVKSHGGSMSVSSEPGVGTTFTVLLPTARVALETAVPQDTTERNIKANGELILLIDDEPNILKTSQEALESFGFRVLTASDGQSGIAIATQHCGEIRAVVVDMMMPGMTGEEVMAEIQRFAPNLPLIGTSGLKYSVRAEQILAAGAKLFLPKPFSVEQLVRAVDSACSGPDEFHVKRSSDKYNVLAN